jgi:hypothetical protein
VNTIKIQALNHYKAAFDHLPAIVSSKERVNTLNGGAPSPTRFDHTIYVTGEWIPSVQWDHSTNPPEGSTSTFGNTSYSLIYYLSVMRVAQEELETCPSGGTCTYLSPAYSKPPISQSLESQFVRLTNGIGIGIGNNAVHETGHQLQLPHIDCDKGGIFFADCPSDPMHLYERYASNEAWYQDIPAGALHWDQTDICAIEKYLLGNGYKSYDPKCK